MVTESRKIKFVIVGTFLVACLMLLLACSSNIEEPLSSDTQNETENIEPTSSLTTVSEVLGNGRSLWYLTYPEGIAKDKSPKELVVFEDGKATSYEFDETFGNLEELTDDEIIEIGRKSDRAHFDSLATDNNLGEYFPPEAFEYDLVIETDNSGNNTISETIRVPHWYTWIDGEKGAYSKKGLSQYTIVVMLPTHPVYSTNYSGYALKSNEMLVTKIPYDKYEFEFDQPGAEGVEVN